jgi:hypothetical protein
VNKKKQKNFIHYIHLRSVQCALALHHPSAQSGPRADLNLPMPSMQARGILFTHEFFARMSSIAAETHVVMSARASQSSIGRGGGILLSFG